MTMPMGIQSAIMEAMRARLLAKLYTEVVNPDLPKLRLIKVGLLQDDPTIKESNLTIHTGGDLWPDVLDTGSGPDMHMGFTYEINGGVPTSSRRRRFRLKYSFYWNSVNRDESQKRSHNLLQRIHVAIATMPRASYPFDVYGDRASWVQILEDSIDESGGEGTFIWRGETIVEWGTNFDPDESQLV